MDLPAAYRDAAGFLKWDSLSRITASPVLKGYQAWVFILPFLVALINVAGEYYGLEDKIKLPITTPIYYLSGLSFLFAMGIVTLFCPYICRHNYQFSEFEKEGRETLFFRTTIRETYLGLRRGRPDRANHFIRCVLTPPGYIVNVDKERKEILEKLPEKGSSLPLQTDELFKLMEKPIFNEEKQKRIFWEIRWHAGRVSGWLRVCAFICILIGFLLAALILAYQGVSLFRFFYSDMEKGIHYLWSSITT
jgi:hypothetical protein